MLDPLVPPGKTVWLVSPKLVTTEVSAPNKVCSISEYDAVSVPVLEELRPELEELALFELLCVVPLSSGPSGTKSGKSGRRVVLEPEVVEAEPDRVDTDPVWPPSVLLKVGPAPGVEVLNVPPVEFVVVWPVVRVAEEMDSTV